MFCYPNEMWHCETMGFTPQEAAMSDPELSLSFAAYKIRLYDHLHAREIWVACSEDMTCQYITRDSSDIVQDAYDTVNKETIFTLEKLPGAMDFCGKPMGAKAMRRWLSRSARAMTLAEKRGDAPSPGDLIETDLIKLDWVLRYPAAVDAYRSLLRSDWLTRMAARRTLLNRIKRSPGGFTPGSHVMDTRNVPALHRQWQFQRMAVGGLGRSLKTFLEGTDDLFAALGDFQFYAAPARMVITAHKDYTEIYIPQVAIYLRDTYDFYGEQYLGHWNSQGSALYPGLRGAISIHTGEVDKWSIYFPISNRVFRAWQKRKGSGGDYIIFSDARVETTYGLKLKVSPAEIINAG